jgi:hypothetical protein
MAHFARIQDGIVQEVIVIANDALDPDSEEASGIALLAESGFDGNFVQCSYSGSFRGAFPGIGWQWDGENFIAPPDPEPALDPITPAV